MSRAATQQDYKDFYESLTPEQLEIVKQADELWCDFFETRLAEEALEEWEKAGRPKGITLEEVEERLRATKDTKESH